LHYAAADGSRSQQLRLQLKGGSQAVEGRDGRHHLLRRGRAQALPRAMARQHLTRSQVDDVEPQLRCLQQRVGQEGLQLLLQGRELGLLPLAGMQSLDIGRADALVHHGRRQRIVWLGLSPLCHARRSAATGN